LNAKIRPADKDRYLLAGSVIKSAYNVRDCNDVDFFVLDHEDNIEKYGRYAPNVGVSGIFDDFGKTYYGNEDYYYPMIPKFFEKQKEIKERQRAEDSSGTVKREEKMILNNFPRFSASGLKAGRYVDIYSGECRRIGYDIDNLDELVSNPDYRVYFLGCPIIQLKLEMIRDNIKDIELERVSKKQMHDLHFLKTNYENLFSEMDKIEFDFKKLESRDKVSLPKILLTVNCYHKELQSDQKVGYDFVIRRIPLYMEDITCQMIEECPLLVSRDNEINMGSGKLTYQNPLLSSLPSTVEMEGKRQPIEYYYELSGRGELKIYLMNPGVIPETSFFSDICITGTLKVEILESEKVITISVTGNKMKKIWSQLGTVERKKEYRLALIIFMKNLIQLHKMVDCHTDEKINIKKA